MSTRRNDGSQVPVARAGGERDDDDVTWPALPAALEEGATPAGFGRFATPILSGSETSSSLGIPPSAVSGRAFARLRSGAGGSAFIAVAFLGALTLAESVTALADPRLGLVLHVMVLVALLAQATLDSDRGRQRLYLGLAFGPLIRMVSLTLPLTNFPLVYWYLITAIPLFAAAYVMVRTQGLTRQYAGLTLRCFPLQIPVSAIGLALGYVEYSILRPQPLASGFTWEELWIPALILLVGTGFLEELVFRGLMQSAAREVLGRFGIVYVAAVFAVLHLGYKSVADVLFVFAVGLLFGLIAARTGSILGVTLAHGLTNITLFLIMPLVPLIGPIQFPLAQLSPPTVEIKWAADTVDSNTASARLSVLGANYSWLSTAENAGKNGTFGWDMTKGPRSQTETRPALLSVTPVLMQELADPEDENQSNSHQERQDGDVESPAQRLSSGPAGDDDHLLLDQEGQQGQNGDQCQGAAQRGRTNGRDCDGSYSRDHSISSCDSRSAFGNYGV